MNNKEIFLSAIKFVPTPRFPVILLSSGIWEYNRLGMSIQDFINSNPQKIADSIIEANTVLNMDVVWTAAGCNNLLLKAIGADVSFDKIGSSSSVNRPLLDSLAPINKISANSIENSREISNLLEARIDTDKIGKEYLVGISQLGPFTVAGLLLGITKFMRMCIKDKETAAEVLDFT